MSESQPNPKRAAKPNIPPDAYKDLDLVFLSEAFRTYGDGDFRRRFRPSDWNAQLMPVRDSE